MEDSTKLFLQSQEDKYDKIKIKGYSQLEGGKYQTLKECEHLMSAFKEHFFIERAKRKSIDYYSIIKSFQNTVKPEKFCPYRNVYKNRIVEWESEMRNAVSQSYMDDMEVAKMVQRQVPTNEILERGVNSLASKMLRDAEATMDDVIQSGDHLGAKAVMNKKYAASVLGNITKLVHGNKNLELKTKADDRENMGFFFELLKASKAGSIDKDSMDLLKSSAKQAKEIVDGGA